MQVSRYGRLARLVLVSASATALGSLAACGGGGGESAAGLVHGQIKVASITQQGNCEDVIIKVSPISIDPGAPKLANAKEFATLPIKMTKGADGVSCTGEIATIPMAPGKWKFTAPLPSDIATCERVISEAGPNDVSFKDGETTCPQQKPAEAAAAPAAPAADAAAPAAPAAPAKQ